MKFLQALWLAFLRFIDDDGFATASHLAMSVLFALFPFLLVVSAIVSVWGDLSLAQRVLDMIFKNWPADTAQQIQSQIKVVLARQQPALFSITSILAIILASNGIEAARTGLNRAYQAVEVRNFFWRRFQSILFVIFGASSLIIVAVSLVAAPLVWRWLVEHLVWLEPFSALFSVLHYAIPLVILTIGITVFHKILPAGSRTAKSMGVGILFTVAGIVLGSKLFTLYLTNIASYSALYAGLSGILSALIYLYLIAVLFLFGAELNSALGKVYKQAETRE